MSKTFKFLPVDTPPNKKDKGKKATTPAKSPRSGRGRKPKVTFEEKKSGSYSKTQRIT
jgi:hypothetical protein